jgi:hypothetical protein
MDTIEDDLKHLDNLFKNALGKIKWNYLFMVLERDD